MVRDGQLGCQLKMISMSFHSFLEHSCWRPWANHVLGSLILSFSHRRSTFKIDQNFGKLACQLSRFFISKNFVPKSVYKKLEGPSPTNQRDHYGWALLRQLVKHWGNGSVKLKDMTKIDSIQAFSHRRSRKRRRREFVVRSSAASPSTLLPQQHHWWTHFLGLASNTQYTTHHHHHLDTLRRHCFLSADVGKKCAKKKWRKYSPNRSFSVRSRWEGGKNGKLPRLNCIWNSQCKAKPGWKIIHLYPTWEVIFIDHCTVTAL